MISTGTPISTIQYINGDSFPLLTEESKSLREGWRLVDEGIIISIYPGNKVLINFEENLSYSYNPLKTFNDLHHSVTIVGHLSLIHI